VPEPSSDRVAFANSLRGVAALCVLVQHYAIGYWAVPKEIGDILHVPPASIGATPAFLAAFSPPSPLALGSFGVALFFL